MVRKETVSAVHTSYSSWTIRNQFLSVLGWKKQPELFLLDVSIYFLFFFTENYNADIYLMIIKDFHSRYLWKLSLDSRPLFYGYIWSCSTKLGE